MALLPSVAALKRRQGLVHLVGVGDWSKTVPARDLEPGQRILWNWGYEYEVVRVKLSASGKSVVLTERDPKSGQEYTRRLGADRLVALV